MTTSVGFGFGGVFDVVEAIRLEWYDDFLPLLRHPPLRVVEAIRLEWYDDQFLGFESGNVAVVEAIRLEWYDDRLTPLPMPLRERS